MYNEKNDFTVYIALLIKVCSFTSNVTDKRKNSLSSVASTAPLGKVGSNCEIRYFCWTFNFMFFTDRAIHTVKIPMKYFFHLSNIACNLKSTN